MAGFIRSSYAPAVLLFCTVFIGVAYPAPAATTVSAARVIQPMDADWRFSPSDAHGGEAVGFDDTQWRTLDVPHDWSIEGAVAESNPAGSAGAFYPTGVGWYRKHFIVPAQAAHRRVAIEFDGVMANSDVWINGFHLGHRPSGYVSFRYDLTGHLNGGEGATNVLAVRADDEAQPASRWYAGAGIYRHVRLLLTDPVHFVCDETFVTTPAVSPESTAVHVHTAVANDSSDARSVIVEITLLDPQGKVAGPIITEPLSVPPGKTIPVDRETAIHPMLWDVEHPNLYQAVIHIRAGEQLLDDEVTRFGIRSAEFKSDTGFWLNGKNIKIKGVCLHGDCDGLGTAVPQAAWEHRLAALKKLGCNAIRTSHNAVAPEFLDSCDRMGFLVMDEFFDCWMVGKNPFDYHLYFKDWSLVDAADTIRRDRNHPSIIIYSAGNEIHDTPNAASAIAILKSLVEVYHRNDPTRPVTQALVRPNSSHDYTDGLADLLDVVGTNYRDSELLAAWKAKPTRKIIGTENGMNLRGWRAVADNRPYAGQFLWVGADYLGEARRWPAISRENGLLDLTDQPHPVALQRQSWWSDTPMVALVRDLGETATGNIQGEPQTRMRLATDWTPLPDQSGNQKVLAFSNAEQVELSLNGKSLGTLARPADGSSRQWTVPFSAGTLLAVARNGSAIVARNELRTAGKSAKIVLATEHGPLAPEWDDVAFITAKVVDDNGTVQPLAADLISFKIDGPGKIAALENGDTNSHEPFNAGQRHAFRGLCTAIVRSTADTGKIHLTATAPGLGDGSIELETKPREP